MDNETKESTRKTEEKLDEGIRKAMKERNLHEGQWEHRKQWSLGVGQRRTKFLIIIISNLSNDRSKASSKTIPPHSAI